MFDFAAQPFFTLVTIFIFAPYFASQVVGDTVRGQAIWGYNTAFAGLVISLLAPVLGAFADANGPRKGWVAGFSAMLVGGAVALWWCLWYLVFVLPLFLLVPDLPVRMSLAGAVAKGWAEVKAMLRLARSEPNALRFLLANMVYTDGLIAISLLGGIYAVGLFGWTSVELALAGILVTVSTTIGAFASGFFDDRFGSKPTIIGGLVMLLVAGVLIVSIAPDRIGFVIPVPLGEGEGLFAAPVERIYLCLTIAIGLGAGTLQSASRALMARLSPAARMTENFGLFALSGRATIFVGPLLVRLVTSLTASQRAGISLILLFFAVGLVLLRPVRAG